jgi:AcrR family transcriptional regulator
MPRRAEATRSALVQAALETLKEHGLEGTTARAIAARAGVNQALVFYHFGGVDDLLLAALDASATERFERYRTAMAAAPSAQEKVAAARRLYREDVDGGHVTVIAELVSASVARPDLRPALIERMQPWLELVADVLRDAVGDSPVAELVPLEEAASAFVALYLGLNLLSRLDPANAQVEALFDLLDRAALLISGPPNP